MLPQLSYAFTQHPWQRLSRKVRLWLIAESEEAKTDLIQHHKQSHYTNPCFLHETTYPERIQQCSRWFFHLF
jgi:hypothetical protein